MGTCHFKNLCDLALSVALGSHNAGCHISLITLNMQLRIIALAEAIVAVSLRRQRHYSQLSSGANMQVKAH